MAGYLPDGVTLTPAYAVGTGGGPVTVSGGQLAGSIGPHSAVVLLSGQVDLTPPAAPGNLPGDERRQRTGQPGLERGRRRGRLQRLPQPA